MMDVFPLTEVILKVFRAGGECAKVDWSFLGLSMPAWVLVDRRGADRRRRLGQPAKSPPERPGVDAVQAVDVLDRAALVDLVDRAVEQAELDDFRAERAEETPVRSSAAGRELGRTARDLGDGVADGRASACPAPCSRAAPPRATRSSGAGRADRGSPSTARFRPSSVCTGDQRRLNARVQLAGDHVGRAGAGLDVADLEAASAGNARRPRPSAARRAR